MATYYGGRIVGDSGETITPGEFNEFGLCEVHFHPGIGSGEEVVMRVYPGTEIVLPSAELLGFSKSGKGYFVGWSTTKHGNSMYFELSSGSDGNGKFTWYNVANYEISQKITISATRTLYAVWFDPSLCTMIRGFNGNLGLGDRVMGVFSTTNNNYQTVSFGGVSKSGTRYTSNNSIAGTEFENVDKGTIKAIIWSPSGTDVYPAMVSHTFGHSGNEISGGIGCSSEIGETNAPYIGRRHVLDSMSFGGASLYSGFRICVYLNKYHTFSQTYSDYAPFGAYICIYTCKLPESVQLSSVKFNAWNNSSESTMRSYPAPYHTAVLLPSPSAYPKAGSTLAAWSTTYNDAPMYRPTGTFVNVGDYDVWTAYYQAAKFIIVYDLNGGFSNSTSTNDASLAYTAVSGDEITVKDGSNYVREGYVHIGWARVKEDGNYQDDNTYVPSSYPYYLYPNHPKSPGEYTFITLKAVWVKSGVARTLTVTDDTEEPNPLSPARYVMPVYEGYTYFIPRSDSPAFQISGYDFRAWKRGTTTFTTTEVEKTSLAYAVSIPTGEDVTITALYSLIEYTFKLTLTNLKRDSTQSGDFGELSATSRSISYTFPLNAPKDIGVYSFTGWGIGANSTTVQIPETATSYTLSLDTVGATVNGREVSITLCAQWVDARPTYRILFQYPSCTDLTSGPPSVLESGSMEEGTSMTFTIPTTIPRRQSQWIFLGWMRTMNPYTGADLIAPGSTVTVTRENDNQETKGELRLYAHWYRYKYDLSYDLQGGISSAFVRYMEYSVLYGARSVMVPRDVPSHPTQSFTGWVDEDGNAIASGNSILLSPAKCSIDLSTGAEVFYETRDGWTTSSTNPEAKTLYAQYTGQTAILSFDTGDSPDKIKDLTYDKVGNETSHTFTIPNTVPTRPAYTFYAWGTSPTDRTTATYAPGSKIDVMFNQRVTLYAFWSYAPAGSGGATATYDDATGELLSVTGTLMTEHGTVTTVGVPFEFSIEPKDGTDYDKYRISNSSSYRTILYTRREGKVTRMTSSAWYYPKVIYSTADTVLHFNILRSSEANQMSGDTFTEDYILRIVTVDKDGKEYNAFHSFTIAPAGDIEDAVLGPAECTLTKYMEAGSGIYDSTTMSIEGITKFGRTFDVSIVEFPVMTRQVRDRYIMDMGTVESYSLSFSRANPSVVNDESTDSRDWSNAQWIVRFRQFLDFWQNLSYNLVENEYKRTGGFKFSYLSSDISLFPVIEKNVFVKGSVDFDYMVGAAKGDLTLVVANMQMKKLYVPEMYNIYFSENRTDADAGVYSFTSAVYQGLPFTIPSFPENYNANCLYWSDNSGTRYFPGDSIEGVLSEKRFFAVQATPLSYVSWDKAGTYDDVTVPNDAIYLKAIIVGGGGAGDIGSFLFHAGLPSGVNEGWQNDNLCDYTSGGGGGSGQANYISSNVSPGSKLKVVVGAGGRFNSDSKNGEDSYVQIGSLKLAAKGGMGATGPKGGSSFFAGGDGFEKGGWFDLGESYMDDETRSPGQTNTESPRGIPGVGNKLGSGGGAAALENGVAQSDVTSIGGYWKDDVLQPAKYGGGGAGGGFKSKSGLGDIYGYAGNGASGYIKIVYYK